MQFIRVFATLLAFGQYRHFSLLQPWPLTSLTVLAAASTLASPIPANSEILAREPEDFEAREPSPVCGLRECA